MSEGEEEFGEEMELARASATERYKSYLIDSLIELMQMSERVTMMMLQGRSDLEGMNAMISRLIHLLIHFEPKVRYGGDKTKDLQKQFDSFRPWIYKPSTPVDNPKEGDRIPELIYLIRTCYERFGLTKF